MGRPCATRVCALCVPLERRTCSSTAALRYGALDERVPDYVTPKVWDMCLDGRDLRARGNARRKEGRKLGSGENSGSLTVKLARSPHPSVDWEAAENRREEKERSEEAGSRVLWLASGVEGAGRRKQQKTRMCPLKPWMPVGVTPAASGVVGLATATR